MKVNNKGTNASASKAFTLETLKAVIVDDLPLACHYNIKRILFPY